MMEFRTVKSQIETLLLSGASGQFRVVGYAVQKRDADEVVDTDRSVQVYFHRGDFPKETNSPIAGPFNHDVVYRVELTVSAAAKVDLALINTGSPAQIASALDGLQNASKLADDSIDELYELVWQILMDARNYDLGLAKGRVSNRWVSQLAKDNPLPRGEYVLLSGSMDLSCRVSEDNVGETPVVGGQFDITLDIDGDDVEQTGVAGQLGGST
jgi:hypothetical protein